MDAVALHALTCCTLSAGGCLPSPLAAGQEKARPARAPIRHVILPPCYSSAAVATRQTLRRRARTIRACRM